ncbi:MAG: hypothetical protein CL484_03500 [Acidobacteria bacterium]|nr:hypothetical protein [Acidobacteriota bacterium]|tara:strand:- start:404 stop:904 length:501 start_codon:yes stop_codon:yes gene_type:complete
MSTPEKSNKRAVYKAAEVCALAEVQPFMLKSWEAEFPDLGVAKAGGRLRVYRQQDLEKVIRIKALIFDEGLTLGAARRKLEKDPRESENAEGPLFDELVNSEVRTRVDEVKQGLRGILDILSTATIKAGVDVSGRQSEPALLPLESSEKPEAKGRKPRRSRKKSLD